MSVSVSPLSHARSEGEDGNEHLLLPLQGHRARLGAYLMPAAMIILPLYVTPLQGRHYLQVTEWKSEAEGSPELLKIKWLFRG